MESVEVESTGYMSSMETESTVRVTSATVAVMACSTG